MSNLKIEYVSKDQLKPYAKNAKLHTDDQVEQIKRSIEEFGFNDPIAVWHDDEIIEGHGRLLAVMEMPEIETVPIIRLDDLTDEQRRAYMLVHNKLTMNTDFDFELLDSELDEIVDIDMSEFGFDINDISPDDFGDEFSLPNGDKPEICTMTFTLHQEQKSLIEYAMSLVENDVLETFGNTNKNGNALYEVVRQWAEQRK